MHSSSSPHCSCLSPRCQICADEKEASCARHAQGGQRSSRATGDSMSGDLRMLRAPVLFGNNIPLKQLRIRVTDLPTAACLRVVGHDGAATGRPRQAVVYRDTCSALFLCVTRPDKRLPRSHPKPPPRLGCTWRPSAAAWCNHGYQLFASVEWHGAAQNCLLALRIISSAKMSSILCLN